MNEKYSKIKELFDLAHQYHKKNNFLSAEKLYKEILELNANDVATLNNLGNALKELKKYKEAIFYYEKALKIKPQDIITNYNFGLLFYELGEFYKSSSFYEKIVKIDPKHIQSYNNLIDIYEKTNNHEKLKKVVVDVKIFLKNNPIIKLYEGILLYKNEKFTEAINSLESFLFDVNKIEEERFRVLTLGKCYDTLGKCYDRTKNAEKAFDCFIKTNNISFQQKSNNVNKNFFIEEIENRKKFFSKIEKGKWSHLGALDERPDPIFMIGFPRSGTTLLDTILRSHPSIEDIEEKPIVLNLINSLHELQNGDLEGLKKIRKNEIQKFRKVYFDSLESEIKNIDNSKIYIDKFPLNIIYVGEIFRIFPKAKFIISLRHPCDCVLSCFMQTFRINNAMANFLNLEDSAKLYDLVMKLWIQYTSIFPINYYEVRYENLVENLETTVRPLLKFLELPWHDSVLEFYKTAKKGPQIKTPSYDQVIKPIYSEASGRWKMYKKQTTNIYPILEPWIKKFNY